MPRLLPDEQLVSRRHPHWVVPFRSMVIPTLLLVAVLALDYYLHENLVAKDVKVAATLLVVGIFGLWLIITWVRWNSAAFTLTTQRVLLESGVFNRSSKVIPVDRVQDVSTRRSLLGRVLGYGTVEIDAAGARGAEVLGFVPGADDFRDQVFVESDNLRRAAQPAPAAAVGHAQEAPGSQGS